MSSNEYLALSKQTGKQMSRIAKVGAKLERAIKSGLAGSEDNVLSRAALSAARRIGGSPGDGAVAIYRDLEMNIAVAREFLSNWEGRSQSSIVLRFRELLMELEKLDSMVGNADPVLMGKMIENLHNVPTEEELFDFKGSGAVMLLAFSSVIVLKLLEIVTWSWLVIIPVGIGAMVMVPALISTFLRTTR